MNGFLLDTNALSELRKPRPAPGVVAFVAAQAEDDLFVSDVAFAEIRFGIEQLQDPERRALLISWLDNELRPLFSGRTLPISEDVLLRWRLMLEAGRRRRHTFGQPDLLIAASAAEASLIVVTRDTVHFVAAPVPVLDPWTGTFTPAGGEPVSVADLEDPQLLGKLVASAG
ncbi:MAG: type II toxin-antitoxin system VapC family toxin [Novosphingobium sp.]|nr:type II toxin-antitoxin system VapC family toxin [Novosphingobium sp.]